MMHLDMCQKAFQIMKELFDLEHDLSRLIIHELKKKEVRNLSDYSSSSENE